MNRAIYEKLENDYLAPYAVKSAGSRGRCYPEAPHPYRTEFQRDRDRIVHSTAFRRLEYKTQVFVNHEGDHFRTRLTHTIEVSIIARSIARALRLNEDLTEAIALAHDLGHTPFGHAGEEALDSLMKEFGGFEHNLHGLKVVDCLETRYPDFPGLNLTFELREGILKHHSHYDNPKASGDFIAEPGRPLECQVVNLADEIAYNCHDVDDGLYSEVLTIPQLIEVDILKRNLEMINRKYKNQDEKMLRHILARNLINEIITDLIDRSSQNIELHAPKSPDDIRHRNLDLIQFSESIQIQSLQLKRFLFQNMYRHKRMTKMAGEAKNIIDMLFDIYIKRPELLPEHVKEKIENDRKEIVVTDYIAGMTDRFATSEFKRLK